MKILIAVITGHEEGIHHQVVGTLCQILLNSKKHTINTYISAMRGIGEHRNVVVKEFLKGDYDYLLFIDSDNPPPENVLDLVDLDKEVIGLPTPINMNHTKGLNNVCWNVFENNLPINKTGEGLEEGDMVGTGVMLIRRDVLEKIDNPFTTVRNEADLRTVGTDAAFCFKCRRKKIKIYTHWDYKAKHFKQIDLLTLT